MKIIFVRHGESKHNAKLTSDIDSGLTRRGKIQAKHLGMKLKKQGISKIYTSNMKRAKETGEIISRIIRVPISENLEELDEYSSKNLRSKLKILLNKRVKKLKKFLKKISKERKKDRTILIIAHGVTNRIIMGYLMQLSLKKQLLRFRQHNTCINLLSWNNDFDNWNMDCMNDVSHLPGRGGKFK